MRIAVRRDFSPADEFSSAAVNLAGFMLFVVQKLEANHQNCRVYFLTSRIPAPIPST